MAYYLHRLCVKFTRESALKALDAVEINVNRHHFQRPESPLLYEASRNKSLGSRFKNIWAVSGNVPSIVGISTILGPAP